MPKSKLTLIVDGNWLLMSRLSVLNNRFVDELELNQELKLMLIKSINVVLRNFPFIDNVIFDNKIESDIISMIESLNIDELRDIIKKINFDNKSIVVLKKDV